MSEDSSNIKAPWIPQTPMKPNGPIYPNSVEEQQSGWNQTPTDERKILEMNDLDYLSFGGLLALANTSSEYFSGQTNHKASLRNKEFTKPEHKATCCVPIIEEPASTPVTIADIDDAFYEEDPEEIPTIRLNMDALPINLKNFMEHCKELQDRNMSNALVALPMPKLKNISQLQVYELPDSHPLLAQWQMEERAQDDPCSYLLAIWTPGETAETVRGTILIPCKTAMRGSFPLNGTYFQVNEVFTDHASSINPIDVPREWLWGLPRRTVYFGTSVTSIFEGLSTKVIQQCFLRGYICVRGFDRESRAPKPLMAKLN